MNPNKLEYVYGPEQLSWTQFKQLKATVGAINSGFNSSAHEAAREAAMQIIASKAASEIEESLSAHEELSEELSEMTSLISELHDTQTTLGFRTIDSLGEIESNLNLISGTLGKIRGDLTKLTNSVDFLTGTVIVGFALGAVGVFALWKRITAINDAVRNPEKSWADEQFRIAAEQVKHGENHLALQRVKIAMYGNNNHPGYPLDFKYHLCAGEILLGKGEKFDPSVVNLEEAETEFLAAEKYAPEQENAARGTGINPCELRSIRKWSLGLCAGVRDAGSRTPTK